MSKRASIGFVLSGGASLGAIQVGMLRALYERGVTPHLIVGTSAGALNGAHIASRDQTVEAEDVRGEIWRGLRRAQVFPLNPLAGLLRFLGTRDHLVPASGLHRLISRHVEHEHLEDMPVALHLIAVEVVSGERLLASIKRSERPRGADQRIDPGGTSGRVLERPRADGRRRGQQQPFSPAIEQFRRPGGS
jgi:predicted acylesterase/phospholipase RssA